MPPRRRSDKTFALLSGCIFPPEVMSRICAFYVPIFQDDTNLNITPLLQTCKVISGIVIPIVYREVKIDRTNQLMSFVDPSVTPSSHFLFIRQVVVDGACLGSGDQSQRNLRSFESLCREREKSLLLLSAAGRSLRGGRGRNGQPRKLPNLELVEWRRYWLEGPACLTDALEPSRSIVYPPPNVLIIPWMHNAVVVESLETWNSETLNKGNLDYISFTFNSSPRNLYTGPLSVHFDGSVTVQIAKIDAVEVAHIFLAYWEVGKNRTGMRIELQRPDEETERMAREWVASREGVTLVVSRSAVA